MNNYTMYAEGSNGLSDRACAFENPTSERLAYFYGFGIKINKATIVAQSKQRVNISNNYFVPNTKQQVFTANNLA